mgnify:CR=1 FL=1
MDENVKICNIYTIDYNLLKHNVTSLMLNKALLIHDLIDCADFKSDHEKTEKLQIEL